MPVIEAIAAREDPTVGDIPVVVEQDVMTAPVESPVVPSPAKATEVPDSKTKTETYNGPRIEDARNRIPPRPRNQRGSVRELGIVLRNVHDLGIRGFNDDGLSLRCYRLLRRVFETTRLLRALAHDLYCVHDCLLLIHVCIPKRRSPGKVLVHFGNNGGERNQRLFAVI